MSHNFSYTDVAKVKHLRADYYIQNDHEDKGEVTAAYQGKGFKERPEVQPTHLMKAPEAAGCLAASLK